MPKQSKYLEIEPGRILSTSEVADVFGVNKATVTRWVKNGAIKTCYVTNSGTLLFDSLYIKELA